MYDMDDLIIDSKDINVEDSMFFYIDELERGITIDEISQSNKKEIVNKII